MSDRVQLFITKHHLTRSRVNPGATLSKLIKIQIIFPHFYTSMRGSNPTTSDPKVLSLPLWVSPTDQTTTPTSKESYRHSLSLPLNSINKLVPLIFRLSGCSRAFQEVSSQNQTSSAGFVGFKINN